MFVSSVIWNRLETKTSLWISSFELKALSLNSGFLNATSKSCCPSSCKVTHGRCSKSASVFLLTIKCNFLWVSSVPVLYLIIRSHLLLQETLDGPYLHIRPLLGTDKPRFVKLYLTNLSVLFLSQLPVPFISKYSNSHVEQLLSARTDQPRCPSQKKKEKKKPKQNNHKTPPKKPINTDYPITWWLLNSPSTITTLILISTPVTIVICNIIESCQHFVKSSLAPFFL